MAGPAPFPPSYPIAPFRRAFDVAQSPYAARNALGITDTGGGGGPFQPLDGDLTAIAGLTGVDVIYYRSAADTWSPVTIGAGLSFSGGALSSTVSTAGLAPINSPTFTGDPQAPTPATADNDTSIATTAFVKAQGYVTGGPYQPLDGDLTSIAGYGSTGAWLYRSGADTWSPVTVGSGLTFAGGTLSASGGSAVASVPQEGRLTYVSATALKFAPFNGNKIKINGTVYTIPNAGIAGLANTGAFVNGTGGSSLAANTTYYVYAFDNSGTVTGDFRTDGNGHIADTTSGNEGVEVRCSSGTTPDPTRTLIGIIRTNASSQFANSVTQRFVRSWFNRQQTDFRNSFTTARTTASGTMAEVNSEIRCEIVAWADDAITASLHGYNYNGAPGYAYSAIGWDGTVTTNGTANFVSAVFGSSGGPPAVAESKLLSEGYHYLTYLGASSAGTATFGVASVICTLQGRVG